MPNEFKKRILFVGMPDAAYLSLSALHGIGANIVGVVPPHKSESTHKFFCDYVNSLGFNLVNYENSLAEDNFIQKLKGLNIDLSIVVSYNTLFPKEFLAVSKDGFINAHPSLLPDYRGANPYTHVLLNEEKETGVTLHFMDEAYDTGDIIIQQKFDINPGDNMGILFNKLNLLTAQMIAALIPYYEEHNDLPRMKQIEREGLHKAFSIKPNSQGSAINWDNSAHDIECFIRALNPFILATTVFNSMMMKIYSADVSTKSTVYPPGTICDISGNTIDVATKEGVLQIKVLQFGNYIVCDAKEFINKFKIKVGDKLG